MTPSEVVKNRDILLQLGLISRTADGGLAPVHPELGLTLLNEPLAEEIGECERAIEANNRQLRKISQLLSRAALPSCEKGDIRTVADPVEAQREIDAAIIRCTDEIVTMQPGGPQSGPDTVLPAGLLSLRPGVALRMLYQHTARANLRMRSRTAEIVNRGGLVRTTSLGLERMFIIDRGLALIDNGPADREPSGVTVVTHPALVLFLHRGFDRMWVDAMPFEGGGQPYDEASVDIKMSLLRMMAYGLKDEVIANRLGVATRTCRRHMSAIMAELDVTSRFQAGVKVAQLRILPEPDAGSSSAFRADAHPAW